MIIEKFEDFSYEQLVRVYRALVTRGNDMAAIMGVTEITELTAMRSDNPTAAMRKFVLNKLKELARG